MNKLRPILVVFPLFQQRFGHIEQGRALLCCAFAIALTVASAACAAPFDAMVKAVKFNDVNSVSRLLTAGVDPNSADNQGMPLLVLAAREKSDDVAKLLARQSNIDLDQTNRVGENALMLAAINNDKALVRFLVEQGAEVNKQGWTPLHYAASVGANDIVQWLLDASAYIDAGSPNGTTPLMMAARGGHLSTVKLLLDEGADMTIKNQLGLTAIDFAKHYHQTEIADGLTARAQQIKSRK